MCTYNHVQCIYSFAIICNYTDCINTHIYILYTYKIMYALQVSWFVLTRLPCHAHACRSHSVQAETLSGLGAEHFASGTTWIQQKVKTTRNIACIKITGSSILMMSVWLWISMPEFDTILTSIGPSPSFFLDCNSSPRSHYFQVVTARSPYLIMVVPFSYLISFRFWKRFYEFNNC